MEILLKPSRRSSHDLLQVPLRRSRGNPTKMLSCMILYYPLCEDLEEVLETSSLCPCMIFYRSLWEDGDPVQILPKVKILNMLCVILYRP